MNTERAELEALFSALRVALNEELAALRQRDLAQLALAVESKASLLTKIDSATAKCTEAGGQLPAEWSDIRDLAAQCAHANKVNGSAIALNRHLVAGLLNTLHGGAREQSTYDAGGKIAQADYGRQVGRV